MLRLCLGIILVTTRDTEQNSELYLGESNPLSVSKHWHCCSGASFCHRAVTTRDDAVLHLASLSDSVLLTALPALMLISTAVMWLTGRAVEGLLNAAEQFNLVLHQFRECHWWLGVMTMTAVPADYGYLLLPPLAAVHQLQVFHPAQSGEKRHEVWMG